VTATAALLLVAAVSALFFYKWSGSLRMLRRVDESGALPFGPDGLVQGGMWSSIAFYFDRIWPALVYGILIGSIVRATVSPRRIASLLGGRGAKSTLAGAVCGSPLMLCSCCVTPVFTGVYERGARLGPSLSLMLASPGLNVAALVLTFLLMPVQFGVVRMIGALAIVLGLAPAIGRWLDRPGSSALRDVAAEPEPPLTFRDLAVRFARSLVYTTLVTVPLIFIGVAASALLLPHAVELSANASAITIAVVALAGVALALPTFFEIPIAFLLLSAGAPAGAAVALLIAGPITNLPSLLVLARETHWRVAAALAVGVWAIACIAGFAVSFG